MTIAYAFNLDNSQATKKNVLQGSDANEQRYNVSSTVVNVQTSVGNALLNKAIQM